MGAACGAQPVAVVRTAAASSPAVPRLRGRRPEPVLELRRRRHQHRHPHGRVERRHRRVRRADAGPLLDAVRRARRRSTTSTPSSPTRSRCRCTASPATRRPPGGRALVWGAGALGSCAVAILPGAATPTSRWRWSPASTPRPTLAERLGAHRVLAPRARSSELVEELAAWSGGVLRPTMEGLGGLPMCHPGGIDVAYDTDRQAGDLRGGGAGAAGPGHAREERACTRPGRWEWSPLYFKEISWVGSNAFGIEEVEGVRQHGIQHYLDLVIDGPHRPHRAAHPHVRPVGVAATRSTPSPTRSAAARSRSPSTPPDEPWRTPTPSSRSPRTEITAAVAAVRGHRAAQRRGPLLHRHARRAPQGRARPRRAAAPASSSCPGRRARSSRRWSTWPPGEVHSWVEHDGMRPALGFEESFNAIIALHEHAGFVAALAAPRHHRPRQGADRPVAHRRASAIPAEEGRRIVRCICFYREQPGDNGYARPIEGLQAIVDMARGEVLEVHRPRARPRCPSSPGSYYPEDNGPLRDDLRPLEITQPEGPSFTVDGNLVRWQRWSLRVGARPARGPGAAPGRLRRRRPRPGRSCTARRSARWSCPTATPARCTAGRTRSTPASGASGRMAQLAHARLRLPRRDPLPRRRARRRAGQPAAPSTNAICMHEEDYGILWKHVDLLTGRHRGAALAPAGDLVHRHRRQLRVRLLLVLLPRRHASSSR